MIIIHAYIVTPQCARTSCHSGNGITFWIRIGLELRRFLEEATLTHVKATLATVIRWHDDVTSRFLFADIAFPSAAIGIFHWDDRCQRVIVMTGDE